MLFIFSPKLIKLQGVLYDLKYKRLKKTGILFLLLLEANHFYNRGVPLFFATDSHPNLCLIYFKISHSHTIRVHAQEVLR